ncbi:hypothetical protein GCM10022278_25200 [Allohahella marinimesophila]|uniref:Uncharacterized protein n=2 Tax=Allohahella marinimesophila TaxID=1054972 RepID=A0ABP7PJ19_9GAMM
MPLFTLIILIALAILGFYAIRQSSARANKRLEDEAEGEQDRSLIKTRTNDVDEVDDRHARQASMYAGDLGDYQKEETEMAIELAREKFGRSLDFSHRSVADVEAILGGAHDYTLLGDPKDTDNLVDWAEIFGCYIATVIQKQTGEGVLARDHQDLGDSSYPFSWRGETLFLQLWCHKRIFDGPEYDVSRRYKADILDRIYRSTSE